MVTRSDDSMSVVAAHLDLTADLALVLFEHSPDAILIVDEAGNIALANRQAELLFGYPRVDLRGSSVDSLLPESLQNNHQGHRTSFMEDPRARPMGVGLDLRARRKNGAEVAVDINLSPVAMKQGMYVIATIRRKR